MPGLVRFARDDHTGWLDRRRLLLHGFWPRLELSIARAGYRRQPRLATSGDATAAGSGSYEGTCFGGLSVAAPGQFLKRHLDPVSCLGYPSDPKFNCVPASDTFESRRFNPAAAGGTLKSPPPHRNEFPLLLD